MPACHWGRCPVGSHRKFSSNASAPDIDRRRERTTVIASIVQRVMRHVVPGRGPRGRLLLVADEAGWILDEVAQQLARYMPPDVGGCSLSADWLSSKDCTIHFLDRAWAWS